MIEYASRGGGRSNWVVVFWTRDETPVDPAEGVDLDGWYLESAPG